MNEDTNNKMQTARVVNARGWLVQGVERAELRRALLDWNENPMAVGPLTLLELRHKHSLNRGPLWSIEWKSDKKIDEWVDRIARAVESDTANLPNQWNAYELDAIFGGQSFRASFVSMRVRWDEPEDDRLAVTRPVKEELQFFQRQARDAFDLAKDSNRTIGQWSNAFIDRLAGELAKRDATIEDLRKQNGSLYEEAQNAKNQERDRRAKDERDKAFLDGLREVLDYAKVVGPVLLNHYLGDEVVPIPDFAHPLVEQLKQLYESIVKNEKTRDAVMQALMQDRVAFTAFGGLMSTIEDFRDVKKARARLAAEAEIATKRAKKASELAEAAKLAAEEAEKAEAEAERAAEHAAHVERPKAEPKTEATTATKTNGHASNGARVSFTRSRFF